VFACLQPIARPKVAHAGEDRVEHWIDERIDLRIYAQIWKAAAPAHIIDVAVFCDRTMRIRETTAVVG
jgi:hypothetical protein